MSDKQLRVTFEPNGRTVYVLPGTKALEAAARAGLTIDTPCGGVGICGKCRIQVTKGESEPTSAELEHFDKKEISSGWRLACQTQIHKHSVIHVPDSSLFANQHQILVEAQKEKAEVLPAVRKVYVELAQPSLDDCDPDLKRLENQIGNLKTDLNQLRELPQSLRKNNFKGTAVLTDHHLIDFEPSDTTSHCYGAAFDIGTTTVIGSLLDLTTGEEIALSSRMNPQVSFGDDVLSRIKHASSCPNCPDELSQVITTAVSEMIDEMAQTAGIEKRFIYELAFSGNTTMQHLLCGLDTDQLGQVPFVPTHARGLKLDVGNLKIPIHPRASVYIFPVIGGFVGGDTVACMLTANMDTEDSAVLMVDIGTNGEIVLVKQGEILAASTAAGPAFEGARISCGMRATTGAIEKVIFDGDIAFSTIGNVAPVGICGSALIDLAAELLRLGVISPLGRLLPPDELPPDLPDKIKNRVVLDGDGQCEFVLSEKDKKSSSLRITVTEKDIRELQLATGAIRAGIAILLKKANLSIIHLKKVLIAGGFGSFIRRSNAQRIGLLPSEIDQKLIKYIGNASLTGSRWALLSTAARKRAEQLASKSQHIELSQDPQFQMEFAEAMIFPSGD